jgi:TM2 domain-containing membrane protein YozV
MTETKYCTDCGAQIDEKAEICPKCGVRQSAPGAYHTTSNQRHQQKNPGLAAVLSALVIGLGQIYNGQIAKGILIFVAAIISAILWFVIIGIIFSIIIWIYAVYDAYNTAQRINNSEIV